MRQCPRCSSKFTDDLDRCRLCGAEMPTVTAEAVAIASATAEIPPLPAPEPPEPLPAPATGTDSPVREVLPPPLKPEPKPVAAPKSSGPRCVNCASTKVISGVKVQAVGGESKNLQVYVDAVPEALVFKERQRANIYAEVCGECGHVSLKVENPQSLYNHYTVSRSARFKRT